MDTRRVDDYVKRMKRREQFLKDRIEFNLDKDKVHYDKAELIALQWMIRYVEDTPMEAAAHQTKWFNEGNNGETN